MVRGIANGMAYDIRFELLHDNNFIFGLALLLAKLNANGHIICKLVTSLPGPAQQWISID